MIAPIHYLCRFKKLLLIQILQQNFWKSSKKRKMPSNQIAYRSIRLDRGQKTPQIDPNRMAVLWSASSADFDLQLQLVLWKPIQQQWASRSHQELYCVQPVLQDSQMMTSRSRASSTTPPQKGSIWSFWGTRGTRGSTTRRVMNRH